MSFLAALPMLSSCLAGVVRNSFDLDLKLTEGKAEKNIKIHRQEGEESSLRFIPDVRNVKGIDSSVQNQKIFTI